MGLPSKKNAAPPFKLLLISKAMFLRLYDQRKMHLAPPRQPRFCWTKCAEAALGGGPEEVRARLLLTAVCC